MNVYRKLQECRVELQNSALKKSGKNKHLGFQYFELSDFLPKVNEMFNTKGLFSKFDISDVASLTIIDVEDLSTVTFLSKTAPATLSKATPVQELGAEHTYIKRYLYVNALEIIENDVVDQVMGEVEEKEVRLTKVQYDRILELFTTEQLIKLAQRYKVNAIEEMTITQASDAIKKMEIAKQQ